MIKKIAAYIYIRGGKNLYDFLAMKLKLPVLRSVVNFMALELQQLEEGVFRFEGLEEYLKKNNFDKEVGTFEDGTKIVERVDLSSDKNKLLGLVSPFDPATGMPHVNFHIATSGWAIYNALSSY